MQKTTKQSHRSSATSSRAAHAGQTARRAKPHTQRLPRLRFDRLCVLHVFVSRCFRDPVSTGWPALSLPLPFPPRIIAALSFPIPRLFLPFTPFSPSPPHTPTTSNLCCTSFSELIFPVAFHFSHPPLLLIFLSSLAISDFPLFDPLIAKQARSAFSSVLSASPAKRKDASFRVLSCCCDNRARVDLRRLRTRFDLVRAPCFCKDRTHPPRPHPTAATVSPRRPRPFFSPTRFSLLFFFSWRLRRAVTARAEARRQTEPPNGDEGETRRGPASLRCLALALGGSVRSAPSAFPSRAAQAPRRRCDETEDENTAPRKKEEAPAQKTERTEGKKGKVRVR